MVKNLESIYKIPLVLPCSTLTIDRSTYTLEDQPLISNVKKGMKIVIVSKFGRSKTWKYTANENFRIYFSEDRVWFHADHTVEEQAKIMKKEQAKREKKENVPAYKVKD